MANKALAGLAGLSAAIGLGLVVAGPRLVPQAPTVDATSVGREIDARLRESSTSLHARLDTLASLDNLQSSVSTDVETVRNQNVGEDIALKPKDGETITIGQVRDGNSVVLLVLPVGATPARDYDKPGNGLRLVDNVLWLTEVLAVTPKYPVKGLSATLAISRPVDMKPVIAMLDEQGISARVRVDDQVLQLGAHPIATSDKLTPVPLASELGHPMNVVAALPTQKPGVPFTPIGLGILLVGAVLGVFGLRAGAAAAAADGPVTTTLQPNPTPPSRTTSTVNTADDVDIGVVIENTYQITNLLGQGGMGAVWQAKHLRLPDKLVAIKFLRTDHTHGELLARFKREAEITSKLGHPNIIGVMDFNTLPSGVPYIVLEYLEGESLASRLYKGPMSMEEAMTISRQIGSALHAAHRAGIVHRDLKPDNVFLVPTDGEAGRTTVKVLDFGISKMRGNVSVQTQDATILGTPQYMSPEQANGKNSEVDARSDIWSLGAIVHEMIVGKPAFDGESLTELLVNVLVTPSPSLRTTSGVPLNVAEALDRALTKDPAQRFADVPSFIAALTGTPLLTQTRPVVVPEA